MDAKKVLFDEETLEQMAFERSKFWSNFLMEAAQKDDNKVLSLDEIDLFYGNDGVEGDWADFEEAEEVSDDYASDPVEWNVTTVEERKSFIESSEVKDILDATLPVLKEHQRKWEAAGLDRILSTFDSVRIEQEVGGWMRRNHTTQPRNSYITSTDSDDSDGSLLSSETADYIRSTRKKCNTQRRRSSMGSIGRFKKFHKIHHNHGTVITTTTYRAYNCNCGKYSLNEDCSGHSGLLQTLAQQYEGAGTNGNGSAYKKSRALLPSSERKTWRLNRECSSSSDSDYVSRDKPTFLRNKFHNSRVAESLKKNDATLLHHTPLPIAESRRDQFASMLNSKFETPLRSSIQQQNLTKTAPSKLSKKRQAAMVALEKLSQKRVSKSNAKQNRQRQKESPSAATKENTFLDNLENVWNSTALNNAATAARQQLPTISENTEKISGATRKKSIECMPTISEITMPSPNPLDQTGMAKMTNVYHSTALNNTIANKELVMSTLHSKNQFIQPSGIPTRGVIDNEAKTHNTTLLQTPLLKRKSIGTPKKSINGCVKNTTATTLNVTAKEKCKSMTPLKADKKLNRIIVYKPPQQIEQSSNDSFQVTREVLSDVIGDKVAQRFLKYNVQALTFPKTSTVYFCPPESELSSSDSDDDPLEMVGLCGELCASE